MTIDGLRQLIRETIREALQIASKFYWISPKGHVSPVGKSEYGEQDPKDMINSGFCLVGYNAKSERRYVEIVYRKDSSPSGIQWRAAGKVAEHLGATEIHDAIKNRMVWLKPHA